MSYGQLIWDVPRIDGLIKNDAVEKKGKVVEQFLKELKIDYMKKHAEVTINNTNLMIYGYDTDKGSKPWFNYTESIRNNNPQVYFIIVSSNAAWDIQSTRTINGKHYYLYKLERSYCSKSPKDKITWGDLKGYIKLISKQTRVDNLFKK